MNEVMNKDHLKQLDKNKYGWCEECKKIMPLSHFKKGFPNICIRCSDKKNNPVKPIPDEMRVLDSDGNVVWIAGDEIQKNDTTVNIPLINIFEVFVQIGNTNNYWVSNYGRVVNNLRNPYKFFVHKMGDTHITFNSFDVGGGEWKEDFKLSELVARYFLVKPNGNCKVVHLDGDTDNNYYKNLMYMTTKEYKELKQETLSLDEIKGKQEYIEFKNKAHGMAMAVYQGIYNRCYNEEDNENIHECYDGAIMCDEWKDDPNEFVEWYTVNYYSVPGESMAVDKDLFGGDSKVYSPETCCILPQALNTLLTNCKMHKSWKTGEYSELPYGIKYNSKSGKYYGHFKPANCDEHLRLSDWDKPEDAFSEFKRMKEADIAIVAGRYCNKIPRDVYEAFLGYEIRPFAA